MRLLRAELKRLRWRGINLVAILSLLALVVLLTVNAFYSSKPPSAEELEEYQASFEIWHADWTENHQQYYEDCLVWVEEDRLWREEQGLPAMEVSGDNCEYNLEEPQLEDMGPYWRESFQYFAETTLPAVAAILLVVALVLGSSFTAAEMNSGSMGTWLTFEPRRTRVYLSKLATLFIWGVSIAAVFTVLGILLAWLVYSINGVGDLSAVQWRELAMVALRTAPLVGLAAIIGGALGVTMRYTTAAAVAVFVWAAVAEPILRYVISWKLTPWLITTNVTGWISGGTTYWHDECVEEANAYYCESVESYLTGTHSAIYLIAIVALVTVAGWLIFRRRDIN